MAGYMCGGCDGAEPAAILLTPLNGAETLPIGENCMPVTWCGILAGVMNLPAEALWDACVALKQAIADAQADTPPEVDGAGIGQLAAGQGQPGPALPEAGGRSPSPASKPRPRRQPRRAQAGKVTP